MHNSHESSIALGNLATFLDPSNFLLWRAKWDKDNPQGIRPVLCSEDNGQTIYEDFLSAMDDFLNKVRRLGSSVQDELRQVKHLQLKGDQGAFGSEQQYGLRLRSMLDKVIESEIMEVYESHLLKIFAQLEKSIFDEFKLRIGFTVPTQLLDSPKIVDNGFSTNGSQNIVHDPIYPAEHPKALGNDIKVKPDSYNESTSKPDSAYLIKAPKKKDIVENLLIEDRKKFAREQLNFLREVKGNGAIMEEEEYRRLLEYVDEMLTLKTAVVVDPPFLHIRQKKVTMTKVIGAFARINYGCFLGVQNWIIDSFNSIFALKYCKSRVKKWSQFRKNSLN